MDIKSPHKMIYRNKGDLLKASVQGSDVVLDVGFFGQGVLEGDANWPHQILKKQAQEVYGLDLELLPGYMSDIHYQQASAEDFDFGDVRFDLIFAGDLIEHLSNPGLFLACCRRSLKPGGRLLLTTPNTFNLFNIAEKLTKREPTVNSDHTFYFNSKVLKKLLQKNGWEAKRIDYIYSLEYRHRESFKKKFLNGIYRMLSWYTDKFVETLAVTAV